MTVEGGRLVGDGLASVCTCKKDDPEWVVEDERLRGLWREAWDRFWAIEAEEAKQGIRYGDRPPFSKEYTLAMDDLYGPEGLSAAITWHRYGPVPNALTATGKWRK